MCLSIPAKILEIKENKAIADFNGKREQVGTELVKDIKIGDYAIISNGFIIKKISPKEAKEILKIINPKSFEGVKKEEA
ncbi:MAG: HypC/HybG/HupF family hydrogenase formation chaperone [Patescibacteria group bacterium]